MEILRVHHLTVAVRDVTQASATFGALFRAATGPPVRTPAFGITSVDADVAGLTLQFVAPAETDSAVARFIERRGEGLYNIAFEVADLDEALAELRGHGVRVSDPVEPVPGTRSAFVAMAETHGVSVQLIEAAAQALGPHPAPVGWQRPEESAETPDEEPVPPPAPAAAPAVLDLRPDDEEDDWSDTD